MTDPRERLRRLLAPRYEIERTLGAGGMATVYLANDTKHHRQVAVKMLRPELAESVGAERFLREIEIAAKLHHPHILPLHDSGSGDGVLYYIMPFVDGMSLRDRLDSSGALPADEAVRITREVLDALEYSHRHGVVHRDIKPENILLSGTHALVTDFGIAKAVRDASGDAQLTSAGIAMGTPTYMAPEQITADRMLDQRVDLYAVGVMAYELFSGRAPFEGGNAQQLIAAHLSRTPDPLSMHRPSVLPELEAVIMRALEKNPADRWQSAHDMLAAFDAANTAGFTHVSASEARSPQSPAYGSPVRVHKGARLALACIVVAAGAVGAFAWFSKNGRPGTLIWRDVLSTHDLVLVSEFRNSTGDATLGPTVTDAVRAELQQTRVVQVMTQAAMWAGIGRMGLSRDSTLADPKVRELAEREGAKAFVVGDVSRLGSGYQLTARVVATVDGNEALTVKSTAADESKLIGAVEELGRDIRKGIGESLRSVSNAPALAQVTTASLPALRAFTAGRRAVNSGIPLAAVASAREALALDTAFASAWSLLYVAHTNMNQVQPAFDALSRAYHLQDRLSETEALVTTARYHQLRGEFAEADVAWSRLVEMGQQHTNYADALLARHEYAKAETVERQGVALDSRTSIGYWNLFEAQVAQQKFVAAESTATRMKEVFPELRLTQQALVGVPLGKRDFESAALFFPTPGGKMLAGVMPEYPCSVDLARGRVQSAGRCENTSGRLNVKEWMALAEFRLTGDSVRVKRGYAAFLQKKPEERNIDSYALTIAIVAELGKLRQAHQLYDEWRTRAGALNPSFRGDSSFALGSIAAAEGQWNKAATAFLDWNRVPMISSYHWFNRGLAEAAVALARLGNADSSRVLLERALETPSASLGWIYESTWYPQALQQLGDIYAARGDREKATQYYEKYTNLMKDAESPVTTQVADVRARMARLGAESAPKVMGVGKP